MVGRKGFERMPVTFLQYRTQETIPRAMLPAIKVQIWGWGVPHGGAQMGKNDQNPKIGYTLLMVGRKGFERISVTFLQHRTQQTIPRAMLPALKVQKWGWGVPHGSAQMGKNVQNPKIGDTLLMVGRKGFQRILITFLQHRTQETILRAMLQAIQGQIWGSGVLHGGA